MCRWWICSSPFWKMNMMYVPHTTPHSITPSHLTAMTLCAASHGKFQVIFQEEKDVESRDFLVIPAGKRNAMKRLTDFLELFSRFRNHKQTHRAEELKALFIRYGGGRRRERRERERVVNNQRLEQCCFLAKLTSSPLSSSPFSSPFHQFPHQI